MAETHKIPRFQVCMVQSQEHPHWIFARVDILQENL